MGGVKKYSVLSVISALLIVGQACQNEPFEASKRSVANANASLGEEGEVVDNSGCPTFAPDCDDGGGPPPWDTGYTPSNPEPTDDSFNSDEGTGGTDAGSGAGGTIATYPRTVNTIQQANTDGVFHTQQYAGTLGNAGLSFCHKHLLYGVVSLYRAQNAANGSAARDNYVNSCINEISAVNNSGYCRDRISPRFLGANQVSNFCRSTTTAKAIEKTASCTDRVGDYLRKGPYSQLNAETFLTQDMWQALSGTTFAYNRIFSDLENNCLPSDYLTANETPVVEEPELVSETSLGQTRITLHQLVNVGTDLTYAACERGLANAMVSLYNARRKFLQNKIDGAWEASDWVANCNLEIRAYQRNAKCSSQVAASLRTDGALNLFCDSTSFQMATGKTTRCLSYLDKVAKNAPFREMGGDQYITDYFYQLIANPIGIDLAEVSAKLGTECR